MNATTVSNAAAPQTMLARLPALLASLLERLADPFAFKSGLLKIGRWESTLGLFQDEYHVPLLPPALAAVAGTAGELFFPVLLALGLFGRIGAVGLFAVNVLAVVSYAHVQYSEGFEAAIGQHYLWGFMLAMLAIYGPGGWSVDRWLAPRLGSPRRW